MGAQRNKDLRRGLLAKIHIARKDLGLLEEDYRDLLRAEFGPSSAADLSIGELEQLVERFRSKGWKGKVSGVGCQVSGKKDQAGALKERVGQMVLHTDFDETRLRGLVRKVCGVEDLRWCRDAVRLKRLVAIIGDMMDRGQINLSHD